MRLIYSCAADAETDGRWRWGPEFRPREFICRCCGKLEMESSFLDRLLRMRRAYKKPIEVISGYRCRQHPKERTKASAGPHPLGRAIDPGIDPADLAAFLRLAHLFDFTRCGLRYTATEGFQLHLDDLTAADGFAVRQDGELFMWGYDRA